MFGFFLQILPEGVGFELGAETQYKHIVMLIHYKNQVIYIFNFQKGFLK